VFAAFSGPAKIGICRGMGKEMEFHKFQNPITKFQVG
jgi:hypothetical protein